MDTTENAAQAETTCEAVTRPAALPGVAGMGVSHVVHDACARHGLHSTPGYITPGKNGVALQKVASIV